MTLSTFDCIAAITEHSAGFAEATRGNLDARVEHCPDWSVADLVEHLTEVHWFWGTIVGELLPEPPAQERRPARAPDDRLVDSFVDGSNVVNVNFKVGYATKLVSVPPGGSAGAIQITVQPK